MGDWEGNFPALKDQQEKLSWFLDYKLKSMRKHIEFIKLGKSWLILAKLSWFHNLKSEKEKWEGVGEEGSERIWDSEDIKNNIWLWNKGWTLLMFSFCCTHYICQLLLLMQYLPSIDI